MSIGVGSAISWKGAPVLSIGPGGSGELAGASRGGQGESSRGWVDSCAGLRCRGAMDRARSVTVGLGGLAGDVNGDGLVDQIDLDQVVADLGRTDRPPSDINRDGVVNIKDVLVLFGNWTAPFV